jgi:bifunctional ADP-heptose synthase (sugar kinase/adenylyltransferase)
MAEVFVFGESCVDKYTYGRVTRLAPDKPVPVLEEEYAETSPGMAGNVFRNLIHLGVSATLITNRNSSEIVKERFVDIDTNHMFLRRDLVGRPEPLTLESVPSTLDVAVVSDYDKGFLAPDIIGEICKRAKISFIDTKKQLGSWALDATIIKINEHEYKKSSSFIDSHPHIKLVKTMGGKGAQYDGTIYPTDPRDVIDVSGAGDTFLAALVAGFLQFGSIEDSIRLANEAAQKVVSTRGVSLP